MAVYCSKCGSTGHPVGACPSLSNPDFNRQQAERVRATGRSAASRAPAGQPKKDGCLGVLLLWALLACAVLLAVAGLLA